MTRAGLKPLRPAWSRAPKRQRAAHDGHQRAAHDTPGLVICPGGIDGQGGIARQVRYVSRALGTDAPPVLDSYGVAAFAACAARLASSRPAFVHLHMAADGSVVRKLLLAQIAHRRGVPVVLHVHGSRFADFLRALHPLARRVLAHAMRRAEAVIALGNGWRTLLIAALGLDPARVHVMPNAVRMPEPKTHRTDGPCRIAFLGQVGARKGIPELLAALARLDLPWIATIAGDGAVDEFRVRAAPLGARISFTGWLDEADAATLLAASDLLVLPSRNEGLPMAVLEAMALGLPVVASSVGAVPELIRDGENGLLVQPGDVDGLARALGTLIADPRTRRALGEAARTTVLAHHEIGAYGQRLHGLYASLKNASPVLCAVAS